MLFVHSQKKAIQCLALLTPLLLLSGGCATTDTAKIVEVPPVGVPGQIMAMWEGTIQYVPDRVNNGRATPAISGRVYLLPGGTASKPVVADGELIITMYDKRAPMDTAGNQQPMEVWHITQDCMKQIEVKDPSWGWWGYTLNLPWITTYRTDISQVRLQVQYVPGKDAKDKLSVFDSTMVSLHHPGESNHFNLGNSDGLARSGNGQGTGPIPSGYVQSSPVGAGSMQQPATTVVDMNPRFSSPQQPPSTQQPTSTLVLDGTKPPVGNAFAQWAQGRINASAQQQAVQPVSTQVPQASVSAYPQTTIAEQAANRSPDASGMRSAGMVIPASSQSNFDGANGPAIVPAATQPYSPSTLPPSLQGNDGAMQGVNPPSSGLQLHTLYSPSNRPQN